MLVAVGVDAEGCHQHQVAADMQAVDLDRPKLALRQVRVHPVRHALRRQRDEPARGRRLRRAVAENRRQIALRQPHRAPQLARRHVDQHQVHRPPAKPVLGLRRLPARQRNLAAGGAAQARAAHRHLAAVEADLPFGYAPPPAGPFRIATVARAGEPLGVLAQHPLQRSDAGAQTKAFE